MTMESAIVELKHSIRTHLTIMAGPTQQLCSFLVKLIDFIEDEDTERKNKEMYALSYNIVEGLALYIQRSIDERAEKSKGSDAELPQYVKIASDEILVAVGKSRNLDEKVAAKHAVLSAVAAAIKALATTTKSQYPEIVDSTGAAL
jgi:hypothetical protein